MRRFMFIMKNVLYFQYGFPKGTMLRAHMAGDNSLMGEEPSCPDTLREALHLHMATFAALSFGGNHWIRSLAFL